jgi:hypothetical protein
MTWVMHTTLQLLEIRTILEHLCEDGCGYLVFFRQGDSFSPCSFKGATNSSQYKIVRKMKNIIRITHLLSWSTTCFIVVALCFYTSIYAQNTYVGVHLGYSFNDLTENYNWRNYFCRNGCEITDVSPRHGQYYGATFRKDFSDKVAFTIGVGYERISYNETVESFDLVPVAPELRFKGKPIQTELNTFTSTFKTHYTALSFPVMARLYTNGLESSNRFYAEGGAIYHYKINESFTPYEQSSNTLFAHNFSATAGLGFEKRWAKQALSIGPTFSYSLTNWNNDEVFQREEKFRPVQIRLNVTFAFSI